MLPQLYRVVVEGELGPRYASAFEGMKISVRGGRTEIAGAIIDEAQLQGVLERISGLGLTLHSVTPVYTTPREARPERSASHKR